MDDNFTQKKNYLKLLKEEIDDSAENESCSFANASVRVLLDWIGYDIEDVHFLDNKDSGIDAYYLTETGIDIYQVKTHDLKESGELNLDGFNNSGINDLRRAKNLLCVHKKRSKISKQIKKLLSQWDYLLVESAEQERINPILVTLHLVVLGNCLTDEADEEFESFKKSNTEIVTIKNVSVKFDTVFYNIDDIIQRQWQEDNFQWKDINGNKKTSIELNILDGLGYISDNKNAVLYSSAYDLVKAYNSLGYQIFEPNVRAEIKRSKINESIRESVKHSRSRKEFKFLNNGVTITCTSFEPPPKNINKCKKKAKFKIHHPGVVNGLQTVTALHTAYKELSDKAKEEFKRETSVLVRILYTNAVNDINDVVRSTNNQNQMKPRNLVSNSREQIAYSKFFAKQLNWFYEAKEGAWNAFDQDPKRWRPSLNKPVKDFKVKNKIKKVDNLLLAQTWMSFFGCSSTAAEEKQHLFSNHYDLIFKKRLIRHGFYFNYSTKSAYNTNNSEGQSPDTSLMFVSYLSYLFAKDIIPTKPQLRKDCISNLGENINKVINVEDYKSLNTQDLDGKLFEHNDEFRLNSVLSYMPFLFTEFVGFMLFESLRDSIYFSGDKILKTESYKRLKNELDYETVKDKVKSEEFKKDDLLIVLWLIFYNIISDWLDTKWKESYRGADRKQRFILSRETRSKLYSDIKDIDKFMAKKTITKIWALGVDEGQGIFKFISQIVNSY